MGKKILGIILLIISILFAFATIGLWNKLLEAIGGLFQLFSNELDDYEKGIRIGNILYWSAHFCVIYFCWKYGKKFIKGS